MRQKQCQKKIDGVNDCPKNSKIIHQEERPCNVTRCPDPCMPTIEQGGVTVTISHSLLDNSSVNGFGLYSTIRSNKLSSGVDTKITVQDSM